MKIIKELIYPYDYLIVDFEDEFVYQTDIIELFQKTNRQNLKSLSI